MAISKTRIEDLVAPFLAREPLSEGQLDAIEQYLGLLLKWNSKMNLTAIRDPEEIVARHFGESLFAAKQLFPVAPEDSTVIDIGSGAGFPGVALKIWNGALELRLIESNHKKATFLREVVRSLGLGGVVVKSERAERVAEKADLVTLRAVERFQQVLPVAAGLLRPKASLALLIGESQVEAAKLSLNSLRWENSIPIPLSSKRVLLVGRT